MGILYTISPRQLRRRAAAVMVDFGLRGGWTVRVGTPAAGAWAHCSFEKRELVFGRALLSSDWIFVNQIILHEVAHALAGASAGHGRDWLHTARAMGYRLGVAASWEDCGLEVHTWVARCETGQHSALRYERGAADGELGCRPCLDSGAGDVGVLWERL